MSFSTRSVSTAVLTNPDILDCIFIFVPPPMPLEYAAIRVRLSLRPMGHLAQCATICRAFHEPVIRILWRQLDTLVPLWQLLAPPDVPCVKYSDRWDKVQFYLLEVLGARRFDDPVIWRRFLWHTARVREIALRSHNLKAITATQLRLIEIVLMKNGGKTVMPLLHSIRWLRRDTTDGSLVPFFTTTLRCATFALGGDTDAQEHALLLRRVRQSSPHLEMIDIGPSDWTCEDKNVGPRLAQELLRFDQLCDIQIHQISCPKTILDLILKPRLTSLTILEIPASWEPPSSPFVVHELRKLSVGTEPRGLISLFNLIRLQALETAAIDIRPSPNKEQEIEGVLNALSAAAASSSLLSIALSISGYQSIYEGRRGTSIDLRELLRPIFTFRSIRSFKFFDENFDPRIEDTDIEALVAAWPTLEHLCIDSHFCSETPALSIYALHHIHAHCRSLRELKLHHIRLPVVGVHLIPAPLCRTASPAHPLRRLSLTGSQWIREPGSDLGDAHAEAYAKYLLELFPDLDTESYRPWRDMFRRLLKDALLPQGYGMGVLAHMYIIGSKR